MECDHDSIHLVTQGVDVGCQSFPGTDCDARQVRRRGTPAVPVVAEETDIQLSSQSNDGRMCQLLIGTRTESCGPSLSHRVKCLQNSLPSTIERVIVR